MSSVRSRSDGTRSSIAKGALLDLLLEIAVGGRHDLHVDRHGLVGAHRQHLALLEHAEQFRLQFQRHLPDLVEEHDAPLGGTEDAERLARGASEGPLLVTEQLALRQRGREGRAVDRHERLAAARPTAVQQPGPEFLARSGLAAHEHRALDLGGALDRLGDPPHPGARSQHPVRRRIARQRIVAHDRGVERTAPRITARDVGASEGGGANGHESAAELPTGRISALCAGSLSQGSGPVATARAAVFPSPIPDTPTPGGPR
jgi:hypothetical protein